MNGSALVSPTTRDQVLAAAQELGFRVNRVAGSLRKNESRVIGLVMSDVANLSFAEVVGGVEAEAALHNYSVILANSGEDLERERAAVVGLLERRADGLIVAPAEGDHSYIGREIPEDFPMVAINRMMEEIKCCAVLSDNEGGARMAVEYLVSRGHSRIGALVGTAELMTSRERLAGYKAALRDAGLPMRDEWIGVGGVRPESACAAAEGVLLAMKQLRLRRDRDVEVIGFDDVPWARLVDPPMPVIAQETHQIGQRAVQMLLGLIGGTDQRIEVVRLPTRLMTNETAPQENTGDPESRLAQASTTRSPRSQVTRSKRPRNPSVRVGDLP
jgi:LacI family transcriptional regulator